MMRTTKRRFGVTASSGLLLLLLFVTGVEAALITEGVIRVLQEDSSADFSGEGFSVSAMLQFAITEPVDAERGEPALLDLNGESPGHVRVAIGDVICDSLVPTPTINCGGLHLTAEGGGRFSAAGVLFAGEVSLLVTGAGRLETFPTTTCPEGPAGLCVRYTFTDPRTTVPEPATVILLAAGLGAVIGLRRAWRV
jgi:PEP-CTERM motif